MVSLHDENVIDTSANLRDLNGLFFLSAIGPCVSANRKDATVSDSEVGMGGTTAWKLW